MKSKIWIILLAFCFAGCSDFLEESSQDEIRPSTVDDMEQLLLGEVYMPEKDVTYNGTDIFTDDQQCYGLSEEYYLSDLESKRYMFTWQKDMFDEKGGGNDLSFWEEPYKRIKGCNVVIDYLDKVTGDDTKREALRAEAHVMRAYYYMLLVNFFGLPYTYGDPETNPGVPLKLDMNVTEDRHPRNSVAEVYRSIEKDLVKAIGLFEENNMTQRTTRAGKIMAKALLCRAYLYKGDWDNAIKYADEIIREKPALLDLSKLGAAGGNVYSTSTPDEIIWARRSFDSGYPSSSVMPYNLSKEFIRLFESGDYNLDQYEGYDDGVKYRGDLRWSIYGVWATDYDNNNAKYMEKVYKDGSEGYHGMRTAEMYLNRAEAYIHKFIKTGTDEFRVKALADLNHLRLNRFDKLRKEYVPVDYADGQALLDFYKMERRREMCGEGNHRWFDLRRYGMPELVHVYFSRPGEETEYTLEKNSPRYVMPIPTLVLKANPKLEQNP